MCFWLSVWSIFYSLVLSYFLFYLTSSSILLPVSSCFQFYFTLCFILLPVLSDFFFSLATAIFLSENHFYPDYNTNFTCARPIPNWSSKRFPCFQGCFYKTQEKFWLDALPDVTNNFHQIRTQNLQVTSPVF